MKKALTFTITLYQKLLSPDQGLIRHLGISRGFTCGFYPTCSEYSKEAIKKYGVFKGGAMSFKRICKCHPWQKNFIDQA